MNFSCSRTCNGKKTYIAAKIGDEVVHFLVDSTVVFIDSLTSQLLLGLTTISRETVGADVSETARLVLDVKAARELFLKIVHPSQHLGVGDQACQ